MDFFIGFGKIMFFCVIWWNLCDEPERGMRMRQVLLSVVILGITIIIPEEFFNFWLIDTLWARESLINLGIFLVLFYVFIGLPLYIMARVIINIYKGHKKKMSE